jgi:hypothetical protein
MHSRLDEDSRLRVRDRFHETDGLLEEVAQHELHWSDVFSLYSRLNGEGGSFQAESSSAPTLFSPVGMIGTSGNAPINQRNSVIVIQSFTTLISSGVSIVQPCQTFGTTN